MLLANLTATFINWPTLSPCKFNFELLSYTLTYFQPLTRNASPFSFRSALIWSAITHSFSKLFTRLYRLLNQTILWSFLGWQLFWCRGAKKKYYLHRLHVFWHITFRSCFVHGPPNHAFSINSEHFSVST